MKKPLVLLLAACLAIAAAAQTATTPTPPAVTSQNNPAANRPNTIPNPVPDQLPNQGRFVPGIVSNFNNGNNSFAASNAMPTQPGLAGNTTNSNLINPTNSASGTTPNLVDLQGSLRSLQAQIQQILPALYSLTGQAMNGQGLTGQVQPNTTVGSTTTQGNTLTPTGNSNNRQLANGSIVGSLGNNSFSMTPLTFEQLRVLAHELRESLPLITALNSGIGINTGSTGSTGTTTPLGVTGAGPSGFTRLFTPIQNGQQTVSPTGR